MVEYYLPWEKLSSKLMPFPSLFRREKPSQMQSGPRVKLQIKLQLLFLLFCLHCIFWSNSMSFLSWNTPCFLFPPSYPYIWNTLPSFSLFFLYLDIFYSCSGSQLSDVFSPVQPWGPHTRLGVTQHLSQCVIIASFTCLHPLMIVICLSHVLSDLSS